MDQSEKMKESKKIHKYVDLSRDEAEVVVCLEKFWKQTGGIGDQMKNCDHKDHNIVKIS